jgi:hypothetical protein
MTPDRSRQITPRLKRRLFLKHSVGPSACALFIWVLYLVNVAFGVDLIAILHHQPRDAKSVAISLGVALFATPICVVIAVVQVRKALALARNGEEIVGTIASLGAVPGGWMRVRCKYSYGGADHVFIWSEARVALTSSAGDRVASFVDPANPNRCMRKDDIFPESK